MKITGRNAIAALLSGLVGPTIGIVMTPFYLRQIGLEGLGLVGLTTVITGILCLFIAGASKTYQRDVSSAQEAAPNQLIGLIRGGILLFTLLSFLLGSLVFVVGRANIQQITLNTDFSTVTLWRSLIAISALLFINTMSGAVTQTLAALRDQVWPTGISVAVGISTAILTWSYLTRWPEVDVFYGCQVAGAFSGLFLCSGRLFYVSTKAQRLAPQDSMRKVWGGRLRENGKLAGILVIHEGMGVVITQIDRIIITALFPLASLGAYNLGANPARMTNVISGPINLVTYPEICRLAGRSASSAEVGEYISRVTFILSLITSAMLLVLVTAGEELMELWLGSGKVPEGAVACLIILSAGHLFLSIAGAFYNVTVAYGRVGYGVTKSLVSLLVLPPVGYLAAQIWGIAGAASVWLLYGVMCVAICSFMVFSRHGDLRAGKKWWAGSLAALTVTSFLTLALLLLPLDGLVRIGSSIMASGALVLLFLICFFGWSLHAWFHAIEIKPTIS